MAGYAELFNEAERLRNEGKIPAALSRYADYLRLYLEGQQADESPVRFDRNDFYVLDRFADLSLLMGKKDAAEHTLTALITLAQSVGNTGIRIHAVSKLFFVHLDMGRMDKVRKDVQELTDVIGDVGKISITPAGLAIWEKKISFGAIKGPQDEKDRLVCLYDMLGSLLLAMGRYAEGILMLGRGIRIAEGNRSPLVDARLLPMKLLLAKAHFENGGPAGARALLDEMGPSVSGAPIASGIPLYYLELRSRMSLAQGRLGEAYEDLFALTDLCGRHRLPLAGIKARFNLAKLKVLLNQVKEATELMEECLRDAESAGEDALAFRIRQYLAVAERRVGASLPVLTYTGRNRFSSPGADKAREFPVRDKGKSPTTTDFFAAYEEQALLFQLTLSAEQGEKAAQRVEKAAELFSQLRLSASRTDSRYIQMHLEIQELLFLQSAGLAIRPDYPFQGIRDFYTSEQLLPALWQFRQLLAHSPLVPEEEKGAWVVENQRLLDQITASLPPSMQTLYLLNKWSPNEDYLAALSNQLIVQKQEARSSGPFFRRWRLQWRLMGAIHAFQENANRYKDYLTREVCNGARPGSFDFEPGRKGFIKKLWRRPFRSLTITYLVLPDRIVIISGSFLNMRVNVSFVNRITLRQLVFDLRDRLYPKGSVSRSISRETRPGVDGGVGIGQLSLELGRILQLETIIHAQGRRVDHLTLIPDDVLHGFPFTLLTLDGFALFDKMTVSVAVDDRAARPAALNYRGKTALLAGISKGNPGVDDLPSVPVEIDRIHRELSKYGANVQRLEEDKATVVEIKQRLESVHLAHFACHGKFDFREPDQSGLLLAAGGILSLKEILTLPGLSRVQMTVLSSCRGAEHFILPGRWIIGLPETLCRAGVQAILAFLWPVDDAFAMAFTTRFYEYLNNNVPALALQRSLSDAIHKRLGGLSVRYWEPQFWAGVVLYQR